ncbi:TetR family transcriptional regulator [Mycolicibacterium aurum]|uniref:TetR family transcriptional regulator n=1 Tax=Mycolicibacterium aurum TaxID=1791 RepID=A0A448IK01_MYCAU|nr:TetR/AcrR family transcriptional regulator [Mycolicibacterium aurum]VEG52710.1 TetR family transcriptional regulator [Mycolicibacterium aurum]
MATPRALAQLKPRWTEREAELLAVTLRHLQEHGYERLTVETVATAARCSKATIYRRWPSKERLVLAAFIEGTNCAEVPPRTGSLRGDLIHIGSVICEQSSEHASTMRAVLMELDRSPELAEAFETEFVLQRRAVYDEVLAAAVDRGEIDADAINSEIQDLLAGYLVFRFLVSRRPPTRDTVVAMVDDVIIPSLTRNRRPWPR